MNDDDLKVFIRGTEHFFAKQTGVPVEMGTPYLKTADERAVRDFSAVIGVLGTQRGCVYFSAERAMAEELVRQIGEEERSDEILADYVGEVANTIAGNARETLGSGFMISVPVVFYGPNHEVRFPPDIPAFIIPIVWNGFKSSLILCLKENADPDMRFNAVLKSWGIVQ